MAWQVSKRVWDHATKIKENLKVMLLALADKADDRGICWPKHDTSYETLGSMLGVDRRSAIRLVKTLCEKGHVIKAETVGRGHSNIFLVVSGLSTDEIDKLISDTGVTISKDELVTGVSPKEKEMVTPDAQNSDRGVTINGLNGDRGVTQSNKSPSIPSMDPKRVGKKTPTEKTQHRPSEVQQESRLMFSALAELCQYDLALITKDERGKLNQAEKKMRGNGYKPDDLNGFRVWWYLHHWKGKQGQAPSLSDIRESWGRYKAHLAGNNGLPPKPKFEITQVNND